MNDPYYKAVAQWAFFDELSKEATWKDVKDVGEGAAEAVKDTTKALVRKGNALYETAGLRTSRIGKTFKALVTAMGLEKKAAEKKEFNKGQFKQLLKNMLAVGGGAALGTAAGHTANHLVVRGARGLSAPWKMRVTKHLPRVAGAVGGIGGILLAARRMKADQLIEEKGNERRRIKQSKDGNL